jgi:quinol monooxygenase YgiN
MWIRLASFPLAPEKREEAIAAYVTGGLPRVRAFPGNAGAYLMEPVADGQPFVACTIWESEAAAKAYDASGMAQEIASILKPAMAGPPELKVYRTR